LSSRTGTAIGVWSQTKEENAAFLGFTAHFLDAGLPVPKIYRQDMEHDVYLLEDLGDVTLLALVEHAQNKGTFPDAIRDYYKAALDHLVRFQVQASNGLDYSLCYPRDRFDAQSMLWDLNYFKYYFLKLHLDFHEEKLEQDFMTLASYLEKAGAGHFMYRDFQARNIMVREGQVYFIDYQGGRKGPLQYDVASLLFQAKAALPASFRDEMLHHYLEELKKHISVDETAFREHYDGFVLIRILQVLGAYGFRGLIEKKPYFRMSIPGALANLQWWLDHAHLPLELPELNRCLAELVKIDKYSHRKHITPGHLTLAISSFSYRNGIPDDQTGFGGGFVFDCRALPNPGREEQYRAFNGKDKVIIDYLEMHPEVRQFLDHAELLVRQSVDNYLERKFERLSVQFGCTGGQHRSVYCAEKLASLLAQKYPEVNIRVHHPMLNHK
jgi:aminoglycoside/choline kinase family phosphotransferase